MDPWEIAVLGIGVVVGLALLGGVASKLPWTGLSFLPQGLYAMMNFLPMGLIMFGFIADIIQQKFRYSIASISGLLAILLNKMISIPFSAMQGGQRGGAEGWCTIPGLEMLESRYTPMTIVSTFTILFYFVLSAAFIRPASENITLGVFLGGLGIFQLLIMLWNGCFEYQTPIKGNIFFNIFAAWLLGAGLGGAAFAVVQTQYPFYLPFETMNISVSGTGVTTVTGQGGGGICQPVAGSDKSGVSEFVCDL